MSEYWKSTPKYWCKHCSTYVKDTPFERKQHESTAKHQNNLKRFLRDIQNSHERTERDKVRAKAEVDRLKGTFGPGTPDAASVGTSVSQSAPSATRKPPVVPASAADQKRQWAQLAEMGIKVPEQFRSEMAMAGDWNVVSEQTVPETHQEELLSIGVKKRKYEGQEEEEEAGETVIRRGWGATTRQFPGQSQANLDDLLSGTIPLVKKEKPTSSGAALRQGKSSSVKQEAGGIRDDRSATALAPAQSTDERLEEVIKNEDSSAIKDEPDVPSTMVAMDKIAQGPAVPIFKKRKAKAS